MGQSWCEVCPGFEIPLPDGDWPAVRPAYHSAVTTYRGLAEYILWFRQSFFPPFLSFLFFSFSLSMYMLRHPMRPLKVELLWRF